MIVHERKIWFCFGVCNDPPYASCCSWKAISCEFMKLANFPMVHWCLLVFTMYACSFRTYLRLTVLLDKMQFEQLLYFKVIYCSF